MAVSGGVKVEILRQKNIERLMSLLSSRAILKAVGLDQVAWIDRNFREEGIEAPWQPLSPNTVAGRRKRTSNILQDTGRLKQSFTQKQPVEEGADAIVVGSNEPTAAFHHFGTAPYEIRPKNKKMLAFPTAGGDTTLRGTQTPHHNGLRGVLSRGVSHPGLPARPILPSEAMAQRLADRVIQGLLTDAEA